MTRELHITLFGEPRVRDETSPVTGFISNKARALLFYLVVTRCSHSRDALATLLWGDMPQSKARKNLTKALSNLRSLLAPYLFIDPQRVAFNQDAPYQVDIERFRQTLEQPSGNVTLAQLEEALGLYQGDFLDGFFVKEAYAFEEWASLERERLRQLRLQGLQNIADQLMAVAEYDTAVKYVEQLLEIDPYRELAYQQLMTLLVHMGQRSAALAQYETCRRILAEELGTTPMPETQALYERIKRVDIGPRHHLPSSVTAFIGRKDELIQLISLLNDPACRLLTIIGPGGIGKTRLALQMARHYVASDQSMMVSHFPDGVYFVPLAALDTPDGMSAALAEALKFPVYEQTEFRQQLFAYLQQKKALLVMDSFEHLLAVSSEPTQRPVDLATMPNGKQGLELITTIIEKAPDIKILVTSRTRLNLYGEQVFPLAGMDFPELEALDDMQHFSAVQLFLESAQRVLPDFELTSDNVADVAHICQLVQGMPLAILLAAAWVTVLTPAEIAAEIGRSLDILQTDMHNIPQRQRSIRAAIDYSWLLLTERERAVFQKLSVFRGDFTREAIQAVTGASLREIMTLVNKSFLHRRLNGRYTIHGLLRQYAAEKLAETLDMATAVHERHCAYYTAVLQQQKSRLRTSQQHTALLEIEAESQNARIAWQWAATHGQSAQLEQALDSLAHFYTWRGLYRELEATFRLATDHLQGTAVADAVPSPTSVRLLSWQAVANHRLGQSEMATAQLQACLKQLTHPNLNDHQDTRADRAFVLLNLGDIARETNRAEAQGLYEKSLALYRALGSQWDVANALASLGWLIQHLGAYDQAVDLYEQSLTIRREEGDEWGVANSLNSLGGIALYQGHHEEAERMIRQSIAIRQKLDDRVGLARSLSRLGEVLTWLGLFDQAHAPLQESKLIYDDLGLQVEATFCMAMLVIVEMHLGHYTQAYALGEGVLSQFHQLESQRGIAYALLGLGGVALGLHESAQAKQLLHDSLTIYQKIGQRDELGQTLALLGYAAQQLTQPTQAWDYLTEAVQTARTIKAFMPLVLASPALALLLVNRGDLDQAITLYVLAFRYPLVSKSRWFVDVAGQQLEEVKRALPANVADAARKQGDSASLELLVDFLPIK